ncbi:hypothetical protein [Salegentibacter maritimus]|uniref:YtxH domain-containing protein n=1 Tax=Salegentibacter maritimus TaxID=2794347 RepID=A0ABS0TFV7_9FLAO|nr:hypothetical protein [Salegentibacter maritimus]MBI6116035.1 hypothetical protein [Salegentibacter maritimus]MBI6119517.1 hypothetical protein [Salegentibacter maritimus]
MKKLLLIMVAVLAISLSSCRETTQKKTEDAVEAIGKDIEDNVKKAGDKVKEGTEKIKEGAKKVEEGAKKLEKEIDEEIDNSREQ